MEEVVKMLGPWPVLQFMFGLMVLGGGVWAIVRGSQKRDEKPPLLEDRRQEWEAYRQLENIEINSFKQVELLGKILDRMHHSADQINALATAIWNKKEGL